MVCSCCRTLAARVRALEAEVVALKAGHSSDPWSDRTILSGRGPHVADAVDIYRQIRESWEGEPTTEDKRLLCAVVEALKVEDVALIVRYIALAWPRIEKRRGGRDPRVVRTIFGSRRAAEAWLDEARREMAPVLEYERRHAVDQAWVAQRDAILTLPAEECA